MLIAVVTALCISCGTTSAALVIKSDCQNDSCKVNVGDKVKVDVKKDGCKECKNKSKKCKCKKGLFGKCKCCPKR